MFPGGSMWGREKQLMPQDDVMFHRMSSFRRGGHPGPRHR